MSQHPDPAGVGAVPPPPPPPQQPQYQQPQQPPAQQVQYQQQGQVQQQPPAQQAQYQQPQQQPQQAPGWHPDPSGRYQARWWDGARWTEHVNNNGQAGVDQPGPAPAVPTGVRSADQVVQDVQSVGGAAGVGGGTLFSEPVLVVSQKAKLVEVNQEYAVYDQHGRQLGAIRQVGQSAAKKVLRAVSSYDSFMTHTFQVVDYNGHVQMTLTRPRKFVKSRLLVQDAAGNEMGQMVQQNTFGKFRFSLESGGHEWGSINSENWRAWNFNILDHAGGEVARITKKYSGLKAAFTTADNYVLQVHRPLEEPLRTLVVAAALGVDQAVHQYNGS